MSFLGIDVGGQTIKVGLLHPDNKLTHAKRFPTPRPESEPSQFTAALTSAINLYVKIALEESVVLRGVGIAVPGLVDSSEGVALRSGTLGWNNYPLLKDLRKVTELPLFLEHDVTAGGLAEVRCGAAAGVKNAVIVQIGTGLACAIVIDGSVHHPHPAVGELGHAPGPVDRPCVCGKNGCLEMTASGGALSRNYETFTGRAATAEKIFHLAQAGEPDASALWNECLDSLAHALHWITSLLGPDVIVISGGLAFAGDRLIEELSERLRERISIQREPDFRLSSLDGLSACIGAALTAREALEGVG